MLTTAAANALHALAAIVWVGGMFFAHMVLRPSLSEIQPPERLGLMDRVLSRFFLWVWVAVFALPATGYWRVMMEYGGFAGVGIHVHLMHGLGIAMIALFFYLYGGPYSRFHKAVADAEWETAGRNLASVRRIVGINLILGLITAVLGAAGAYWA